jgi:hypothetical protein
MHLQHRPAAATRIGLAAIVVLVAGCGSSNVHSASKVITPIANCSNAVLAFTLGPLPGLASQERAVIVAISNTRRQPCAVSGYPRVRLSDRRGRVLPFHVVDGAGPFVTKAPPAVIALRRGATAYVLLAATGCTVEVDGIAASAALRLAGRPVAVSLSLVRPGRSAGLALCRDDPSPTANTVWVSPVERDVKSLVA